MNMPVRPLPGFKKARAEMRRQVQESCRVKQAFTDELLLRIYQLAIVTCQALRRQRRVYLMGNGGSAADAQHIAAELVGRFRRERLPLPAIALTTNTSILTAVGNDYSFEDIFARQISAMVGSGDVVVALSTSGNSPNIIRALKEVRRKKAVSAGLTGQTGGKMKHWVDILINVPSSDTQRIQEAHSLIGHLYCGEVEKALFPIRGR